jgi:hypothetical protein
VHVVAGGLTRHWKSICTWVDSSTKLTGVARIRTCTTAMQLTVQDALVMECILYYEMWMVLFFQGV